MVDRGNCTFTKKANSAQNANASAILIINNQKGKKIRENIAIVPWYTI